MSAFIVAIYARFSTSLQNPKSTDDQVAECKRMALLRWPGCQFVEYVDPKISGAFSGNRPAYQRLLTDLKARPCRLNAVVAEDLDRIARDIETGAHLHKVCKFAGIDYVTISDGEITDLHVGLKGTMNQLFLSALALKTRRGCRGDVERGALRGAPTYGYARPAGSETWVVDTTEAAIVRRILGEYAAGVSALMIARRLNQDGIPGRNGRWTASGINGHVSYGTGLINNQLFVGRYIWNRLRYKKDPDTGKKVPEPNPEAQWVVVSHPELRIVSDALWGKVKARQQALSVKAGASQAFRLARRPTHLLSGLVKCALCGQTFISTGRKLICQGKRSGATCASRQTTRAIIERRVRAAIEERLFRPELQQAFAAFFKQFVAEENARREKTDTKTLQTELVSVKAKADRLLDLAASGVGSFASVREKLAALEARRGELEAALAAAASETARLPVLHPNMAEGFRTRIRKLYKALDSQDAAVRDGARDAVRLLIDRIDVQAQAGAPDGVAITIIGNLGAVLVAAGGPELPLHTQALAPTCQRLCVIAA